MCWLCLLYMDENSLYQHGALHVGHSDSSWRLTPAWVAQEVVLGLPQLGGRVSEGVREQRLLPAYRALVADGTWLVRAAAAAMLPAMTALLPPGGQPSQPHATRPGLLKAGAQSWRLSWRVAVLCCMICRETQHSALDVPERLFGSLRGRQDPWRCAAGDARGALADLWRVLAEDSSKWVSSCALASLGPLLALLPADCITDGAHFNALPA